MRRNHSCCWFSVRKQIKIVRAVSLNSYHSWGWCSVRRQIEMVYATPLGSNWIADDGLFLMMARVAMLGRWAMDEYIAMDSGSPKFAAGRRPSLRSSIGVRSEAAASFSCRRLCMQLPEGVKRRTRPFGTGSV